MKKIIEIDLINKEDIFDKYNKKNISNDLIEYIINETLKFDKKEDISFVINNRIEDKEKYIDFIKSGLKKEMEKTKIIHRDNNFIQIIYFVMGIFLLSLSMLVERTILKELILIGGWVLIWEMIEIEIISDMNIFKRRRVLKKLLNSEFIEKNKK